MGLGGEGFYRRIEIELRLVWCDFRIGFERDVEWRIFIGVVFFFQFFVLSVSKEGVFFSRNCE